MTTGRRLIVPLGLAGLAVGFWWFQSLNGFNPTDDGFILAQSWRVLNGEVPHVDFTSPRPLGSAYLHVLDVLPAAGTLAFSRFLVTLQLIWVAFAAVDAFPAARSLRPVAKLVLTASAFLVNVGVWPIMAWHTIDGIFLGVTALWLATRAPSVGWRQHACWALAWLVAGASPLIKQGFVVVPVAVALVVLARRAFRAYLWVPLALVPLGAYALVTLPTPGGVLSQFYSGSSGELTQPFIRLLQLLTSLSGLATIAAVVVAVVMVRWSRVRRPLVLAAAPVVAVAVPLAVAVRDSFSLSGSWAYLATLALIVAGALLIREWVTAAVVAALLALGFGSSLSWGAAAPTLLAGSFLASVALLLVRPETATREIGASGAESSVQTRWPLRAQTIALAAIALVLVPVSIVQRDGHVYQEPDAAGLTATIADPAFALIRTSPQTAAYVDSVRTCVGEQPPAEVALLPDNPGLYPLLRLHNPFALDWWLWAEQSPDHSERVDETLERLNATSDWLVLVGTINASTLASLPLDEIDRPMDPPTASTLADDILDGLDGEQFTCASFHGKRSD